MPSLVVQLYSVVFKLMFKHKLLSSAQPITNDGYGALTRPSGSGVPTSATFVDGVATKDINIDPFTSLCLRIFLPQSALPQDQISHPEKTGLFGFIIREDTDAILGEQGVDGTERRDSRQGLEDSFGNVRRESERRESRYGGDGSYGGETRRNSDGGGILTGHRAGVTGRYARVDEANRWIEDGQLSDGRFDSDDLSLNENPGRSVREEAIQGNVLDRRRDSGQYQGYLPGVSGSAHKKLPIIVQFHGGGFVTGSKDSASNDFFCRRIAKLCDAIVVAVGYRLAPEHKYPAAFDDGFEALIWLAKQANLAECCKSLGHIPAGFARSGSDNHRPDLHKELVDSFGASAVEPWLAAHCDLSRCVLLGVSSGGTIADHVARRAVQAGKLLEPVKVVAQVLMYPFFIGSIPTHSEIKLSNAYFYDKAACILAWKLLLPDGEYDPDHPVANPLIPGREPPLKKMPPTLTVVAELDWMKDRAIAYSEALRKANVDAPVLEYKDAVHEFATLDFLVKSRQAEACAEDMTIWIKKYISLKGHELSY